MSKSGGNLFSFYLLSFELNYHCREVYLFIKLSLEKYKIVIEIYYKVFFSYY